MKKILTLCLIFFVTLTSVAMAAKKPVRIARLPILVQNNLLDYETSVTLEMKIARAVNIPLNNTSKVADYISPKTSEVALNEIWQKLYAQNKNAKLSDAVKILADDLNADLVICPILNRYYQNQTISGVNFEAYLSSDVAAEMIIYDKSTKKLIDKKFSRRFNDNYNKYGTASYLAGECFDQLIKDTDLKKILRNKSR